MGMYFPSILPDELLYSAIARYRVHTVSSSAQALAELAGGRNFHAEIDLPSRISHILAQSPLDRNMSESDVILRHTLLPFYGAFAHEGARLEAMDMMANGNRGRSPRSVLGIYGSSKGNGLYYCPACVEEDIRSFGEPYWHRLHRAPGVLACPSHRLQLISKCQSCGHEYKSGKYEYMALAEFCPNGHPLREGALGLGEGSVEKTMLGYALDAQEVLATYPHYEPDALHHAFQERLKKLGLVTLSGTLRQSRLGESFISHYGQELLANLDSELDLNSGDNWLFRAFRHCRKAVSPVKTLLVIRFLFGSFQEFVRDSDCRYEPFGPGPWPCFNRALSHFGENRINSFASKTVGGTLTGKFTCDCGFTYTRRAASPEAGGCKASKVLNYGTAWNEALSKLRQDGKSIRAIARTLGVARSTVSNHLKKVASLQAGDEGAGRDRDTEVEREKHRAVLTALMASDQSLTRTQLRRQDRGAYNWLWRNDRPWMESHLPEVVKRKTTAARKGSVDWNARDETLCQKVGKAMSSLLGTSGRPERITKRRVLDVAGLGPSAHVVGEARLPRTNELLKEAAEPIEDFELRKVLWSVEELVRAGAPLTKYRVSKTAGLSRKRPSTEQAITDVLATISKEGGSKVERPEVLSGDSRGRAALQRCSALSGSHEEPFPEADLHGLVQ